MKKYLIKTVVFSSLCGMSSIGFSQSSQPWMSNEVADAWKQGYKGQNTAVIVVDDFRAPRGILGNLTGAQEIRRHGDWASLQTKLIAPSAMVVSLDYSKQKSVTLYRGWLNTLNLSYGMIYRSDINLVGSSGMVQAPSNLENVAIIDHQPLETSIIDHARNGRAVVVKSAGNNMGQPVGFSNYNTTTGKYETDLLSISLIGAKSAIFVGALEQNGTPGSKVKMASYSNVAGSDPNVQKQFLVVGWNGGEPLRQNKPIQLLGTSFAAPIISGYAAILGSKFQSASAEKISRQLLNTARTDTIVNYDPSIHGKGEASLTRALAPQRIF